MQKKEKRQQENEKQVLKFFKRGQSKEQKIKKKFQNLEKNCNQTNQKSSVQHFQFQLCKKFVLAKKAA